MKKRSATEKIISLMFNMGRAIKKQCLESCGRADGLSILQIEALWHVKEGKEVLMKDLASHLFIAPPSATSLADDLVKAKLVKRSEDKEDRRTTAISLTPKGKRALANFLKKRMEKAKKRIDKLTQAEKKSLFAILEKLAKENDQSR
ncbi:MAG TPA: MarR family transcriptional regulator [Candidatus Saccharimonadales bacterium]|nr:MarR family transcriptional regulator [Candidatus Saccharimonadales bacterium]